MNYILPVDYVRQAVNSLASICRATSPNLSTEQASKHMLMNFLGEYDQSLRR